MRELYTKSKRHLLINTEGLIKVLDDAFKALEIQEAKLNGHQLTIAEHYFDLQVLQYLRQEQPVNKSNLLSNLKQRLDLKFLVPKTAKEIQGHYETLQQRFLKRLQTQAISLPTNKTTLVNQFQKEWENILITLIFNSEKQSSMEAATAYWYRYHLNLSMVQKLLGNSRQELPPHLKSTFLEPFHKAFKELLENLERDFDFLTENSDAFIIHRLKNRIKDQIRYNDRIKENEDSLDATDLDRQINYRAQIDKFLSPQIKEYLPTVKRIIAKLGEPCFSFLSALMRGVQQTVIAEQNNYSRAYASQLNNRCLEEVRTQIINY